MRRQVLHPRRDLRSNEEHLVGLEDKWGQSGVCPGGMAYEELVQIALTHVLEEETARLLSRHDAQKTNNVRVAQVTHQVNLAVKVLPRLGRGGWFQRFYHSSDWHVTLNNRLIRVNLCNLLKKLINLASPAPLRSRASPLYTFPYALQPSSSNR